MEPPAGQPAGTARGLPFKDTRQHRPRVPPRAGARHLVPVRAAVRRSTRCRSRRSARRTFLDTLRCDVLAHPKARRGHRRADVVRLRRPRPAYMRYGVVGPSGAIDATRSTIDLPGPRLPHDMAITENYSVLMDLPLARTPRPPARAATSSRSTGRCRPRFAVHPAPRRRRDPLVRGRALLHLPLGQRVGGRATTIVMDVCRVTRRSRARPARARSAKLLGYLRLDARLHRYGFDLATGTTTETPARRRQHRVPVDRHPDHRHARAATPTTMHISPTETVLFDGLLRYDRVTGERQDALVRRPAATAARPRSPRATARPARTTATSSRSSPTSATAAPRWWSSTPRDLTAGPVARVRLPQRVPIGFHATWVRPDQLRPDPVRTA